MVSLFSHLDKKERAPGQSLEVIVSRLPVNDLEFIAGSDFLRLLKVVKPKDVSTALRSGAYYFLKTSFRDHIAQKNTRAILYSAMTPAKLEELCTRIGLDEVAALESLDPTGDSEIWSTYAGFFGFNAQESVRYSVPPDATTIAPEYPLFAHQRRAAEEAYRFIRSDRERVMLHMPTGSGKTRTTMHVICRYLNDSEPRVVVWVASSSELLEQAAEAFQNAWQALGNRVVSIYRYWGQYDADFSSLKDGILIAGFQKLYACTNANPLSLLQLGSRVGLVVVDEAHQAIAPSYQEVIERIARTGIASGIVGLSATPGRTWSDVVADEQLAQFFDKHKVVLRAPDGGNPVTFLIQKGYLARPKFTQIRFRDAECRTEEKRSSALKEFDPETLEHLAALADRNAIILGEIERLIGDGHSRIILFAASVRHAELLTVALMSLGVHATLLTAVTSAPERMRSIKLFRGASDTPMVLCNFGVLTTGFDAPRTSAAVIVRPTRSLVLYSQMVGRAIRGPAAGGNEACEIVTIVDTALPGFGDVADAFSNWEDVWDV